MGSNHDAIMESMQNLILATTFPGSRGKNSDPIVRIIQDADLAHLGLGLIYWIWASMGLLDEFNKVEKTRTTPYLFIHEGQEKFVKFVASLSGTGKFFLSKGAQEIFADPLEVVKEFKNIPTEAIDFAYKVRRDDITVAEFTEQFNEFLVPA